MRSLCIGTAENERDEASGKIDFFFTLQENLLFIGPFEALVQGLNFFMKLVNFLNITITPL